MENSSDLLSYSLKNKASENIEIGSIIYENGKFGTLYKAHYIDSDISCVVRVLSNHDIKDLLDDNKEYIEILNKWKTFYHKNIVRLIDVFEVKDSLWKILEKLNGLDLCTEIHRKFKSGFAYNESIAIRYIKDLLEGIEYLHKNSIVNRNIQPHTITVSYNPLSLTSQSDLFEKFTLKINDFSRASILEYGKGQKIYDTITTIFNHFASPEILSRRPYNHSVDIWSVGVICYILISGRFPFCASSLERLVSKIKNRQFKLSSNRWSLISDEAKDFLSKMFEPEMEVRYSAEEALRHSWFQKDNLERSASALLVHSNHCIELRKKLCDTTISAMDPQYISKFRAVVYVVLTIFYLKNSVKENSRIKLKSGKDDSKLAELADEEKCLNNCTIISEKQVYEVHNLLEKISDNITKNTMVSKETASLLKNLNSSILKVLIECYDQIRTSEYHFVESKSDNCGSLNPIETKMSHQKTVILKKETQNQKIGILAVSTPSCYCIIAKIIPGELADREGTLKIGDRIISINDVLLESTSETNDKGPEDINEKSATIVRKAYCLLGSLDGEIKIVVEPGYQEMVKDRPILERKLSIANKEENSGNVYYVRALKNFDVEGETDNLFYHTKCAKMRKGDIFTISNLYPTQERWWIGIKITKTCHPSISPLNSYACVLCTDDKHCTGYIPFQFDIYKNYVNKQNKNKNSPKYKLLLCRKKSREEVLLSSTRKKRNTFFGGWYEEMILSTNFKYKSIVLIGPKNVNFSYIIRSICSRLVLTHCTVPQTTTNIKLACNSKYRVIKEGEFLNIIKSKSMIEWNIESNSYYGITKKSMLETISMKKVPILLLNAQSLAVIRTWQYCPLIIYMQSSLDESDLKNNDVYFEGKVGPQNEFQNINKSRKSSSQSSLNSNDFETVRHLVDFFVTFKNLEDAESQILSFIQTPVKTFVNKNWISYQ